MSNPTKENIMDLQKDLNALLKKHGITLSRGTKIRPGYTPVKITDSITVTMNSNGMAGQTSVRDSSGLFVVPTETV